MLVDFTLMVQDEKVEAALYVVASPIGNRGDITLRALQILDSVDAVAAEDTRHTRRLLESYGINTPVFSCHENNEQQRVSLIFERIMAGESVALVTDAGTPLISDPGYTLVKQLRAQGVPVKTVPGACAVIAALSVAGLPTDRFCFEGFLPAKAAARKVRLEKLVMEPRTLVFYEAPHRIVDFLDSAAEVFGNQRHMVLGRELTKRFETILEGSIEQLRERVSDDENQQKGEFVVMLEGAKQAQSELSDDARRLLQLLCEHLPLKVAASIAAQQFGGNKKDYYKLGLELKSV